jgi:hypothetical protein
LRKYTTDQEIAARRIVVQEASEWPGTPFRWGCLQKGKGADCAEYAIWPYKKAGLIEEAIPIPRQLRDWLLAGKELIDPLIFRKFIEQFADRIDYSDRLPGDLVTFVYLGVECHVGVIVDRDPDWMIDAVTRGTVRRRRLQAINSLEAVYRHKFFTGSKAVFEGLSIPTAKEAREALQRRSRSSQEPERGLNG